MNTTMMQSILAEPDAHSTAAINDFMEKIFDNLCKDEA